MNPPGSYAPSVDHWGSFEALCARMPAQALVVVDERVARLHPGVPRAIRRAKPAAVLPVRAGERAKSLPMLERLLGAATGIPRSGTLVAIGGGTVGDLATVAAHLIKRGIALVHVPTTLLAAVDSSLGGKGAVHVERVKNAAGVFHYPRETWLCPELFDTLTTDQVLEGCVEAWKMAACLDARLWRRCTRQRPGLAELIREARRLKEAVCRADPYEQRGRREVLNFGHTFGHVLETLSGFKVSHGSAVAVGLLCALDVGRALRLTPGAVAREVEDRFQDVLAAPGRRELARVLSVGTEARVSELLRADKKRGAEGLRMVLLREIGRAEVVAVPDGIWRRLFRTWRAGARP